MKTITLKSVMAVLIALFSLNANAYDVEIDGIYYNLVKKAKTAEVTSGDQSYKGDVKIPSSFTYEGEEYSVITIKSSAFNTIGEDVYAAIFGEDVFRSISIPPSIKKIENGAFVFCDNLTSVYIEDLTSWCNIDFGNGNLSTGESNPLSYAKHLFLNGEEIKDLIIPEGVETISGGAFHGCTALTSVKFPSSLKYIRQYAFGDCTGLSSIDITEKGTFTNIKSLRINAKECSLFCFGLSNLESIIIGKNVENISESIYFQGTRNIQHIEVEVGYTTYDDRDNCSAVIETSRSYFETAAF